MSQDTGLPNAPIIGIDLDNTLAIYDELLQRLALERRLITSTAHTSKKAVRDSIRNLPDGETEWQKLQGLMYGPRMGEACLNPDAKAFLILCRRNGAKIFIISHKTEFANYDDTQTNLRQAAMEWMSDKGFFDPTDLGLSRDDVTFVGTRQEKVERIEQLGCTHFIDDLEEVFQETSFPAQVQKILFASDKSLSSTPGFTVNDSWQEIARCIFPDSMPVSVSGQSQCPV